MKKTYYTRKIFQQMLIQAYGWAYIKEVLPRIPQPYACEEDVHDMYKDSDGKPYLIPVPDMGDYYSEALLDEVLSRHGLELRPILVEKAIEEVLE